MSEPTDKREEVELPPCEPTKAQKAFHPSVELLAVGNSQGSSGRAVLEQGMPSVRKDKGGGMTKETRAVIEAAEQAYEALRLSYNVTDYPANGDTIQDHAMTALKAAISSAKAAEEGVETMYRVDVADRIGWVMTAYDRFHKTQEAASNRANRAFTSVESIVRARVVCVETRETVIEVREKEGK